MAMEEARNGDIVLLAGKGHENYQILADRTLEFDDRDMARRALRERGFEGPQSEQGSGGGWERKPRGGPGVCTQRAWFLVVTRRGAPHSSAATNFLTPEKRGPPEDVDN